MSKRALSIVIVLMAVSLVGIGALEWYWLQNAYALKSEEFDKSVNEALVDVVDDLEQRETVIFIKEQIGIGELDELEVLLHQKSGNEFIREEIIVSSQDTPTTDMEVMVWADEHSDDEEIAVIRSEKRNGEEEVTIRRYATGHKSDTLITYDIDHRVEVVGNAMQKILIEGMYDQQQLETRIQDTNLDSLIAHNLQRKGIDSEFSFGVTDAEGAEFIPGYNLDDAHKSAVYEAKLFPHGRSSLDHALVVSLPQKSSMVLSSMAWILSVAIGLAFLMLVTFSLTIFFILRQKKISRMKSDFINNMTHEFKTPLATIGLAVDSIEHPEVKESEKQVSYFTGIIKEENKRMNRQVEQVLQAARIEQGSLKFNFKQVDFNALVEKAARQMDIQVRHKDGSIQCTLASDVPELKGDEMHLYNAIVNLLDNAIKYCKSAPQIALSTIYDAGKVKFAITDNGIGMSKEVQKKVFDRFFRAQGGDLHDVKGFGLGLNYVKAIVDKHEGSIDMDSDPGKGTTITISLPHS